MAATIQRIPDGEDVWGRMRVRFLDVIFDTAYPNPGGYVIRASDIGMKAVYSVDLGGENTGALAWNVYFDINASVGTATAAGVPEASFAIKLFVITTGVQVANGVDVSAGTIRIKVIGR